MKKAQQNILIAIGIAIGVVVFFTRKAEPSVFSKSWSWIKHQWRVLFDRQYVEGRIADEHRNEQVDELHNQLEGSTRNFKTGVRVEWVRDKIKGTVIKVYGQSYFDVQWDDGSFGKEFDFIVDVPNNIRFAMD